MIKIIYKKYCDLPIEAKAAAWYAFGNLLLKGIGIFSGPLFTRLLPVKEYGLLMIFSSWQQVILIFATWEIYLGAYQKGVFKFRQNLREYTSATLALVNLLTVLCFAIILTFQDSITAVIGMDSFVLFSLFCYLCVFPAYQCWTIRQRTDNRYKSAVAMSILNGMLGIVVPLVAVLFIGRTAEVRFTSGLLTSSVLFFCFYLPYANYFKLLHSWNRVRKYWKFSLCFSAPLIMHSLSYMILNQSDRIMIGIMAGTKEAAYYSVAYTLSQSMGILQTSVCQSLLPWQYKMMESREYGRIKNVVRRITLFICGCILLFETFSPEIMIVLFPKDYYEAIFCVPPIISSLFFLFLYSLFVNIETYFEKTVYVMYVSFSCALVNIMLNYIFIPIFGYIACAYTTLFCYILFAVGHFCFLRRLIHTRLAISVNVLYDLRGILVQGMALVILSHIIETLFPHPYLRYALLSITSIALFYKWEYVCSMLKNMK